LKFLEVKSFHRVWCTIWIHSALLVQFRNHLDIQKQGFEDVMILILEEVENDFLKVLMEIHESELFTNLMDLSSNMLPHSV